MDTMESDEIEHYMGPGDDEPYPLVLCDIEITKIKDAESSADLDDNLLGKLRFIQSLLITGKISASIVYWVGIQVGFEGFRHELADYLKYLGITSSDIITSESPKDLIEVTEDFASLLMDYEVTEGLMQCRRCSAKYPISQGIPNMILAEEDV